MGLDSPIIVVYDDRSVGICATMVALQSKVEIDDVKSFRYYDSVGRLLVPQITGDTFTVIPAEDSPGHAEELKQHITEYLSYKREHTKVVKARDLLPIVDELAQMSLSQLIDLTAQFEATFELQRFNSTPTEEWIGVAVFVGLSVLGALAMPWLLQGQNRNMGSPMTLPQFVACLIVALPVCWGGIYLLRRVNRWLGDMAPKRTIPRVYEGTKSKEGQLIDAVLNGVLEQARQLLEAGVSPNFQVPDYSETSPLGLAVKGGNADLVNLLLDHGADLDLNDEIGGTPLTDAVSDRNIQMVTLLLNRGASVNCLGMLGTALDGARRNHSSEIERLLLEHGALAGDAVKAAQRALKGQRPRKWYQFWR